MLRSAFRITGTTSNSAAVTTVIGSVVTGLLAYNTFTVHANILGATGGALNLRLQRQIAKDVWSDWASFVQLAAAATAISYALESGVPPAAGITAVGGGTDALPTNPGVLTAGVCLCGHPGDSLRLVATTGAGTTLGAAQTIYIIGYK